MTLGVGGGLWGEGLGDGGGLGRGGLGGGGVNDWVGRKQETDIFILGSV